MSLAFPSRRHFVIALATAGFTAGLTRVCQAADRNYLPLPTEVVADQQVSTGKYKHPAAITELTSGDLYLAWYGGDGEYEPNTGVYGVRLPAPFRNANGGRHWSAPVLIAQDPFRSVGNPVIWQAPPFHPATGLVWLFYVVRFGETWSDSRIAAKVSRDGARTWSDSSLITLDKGLMVRGKPIVLSNQDVLLPVYREVGNDRELVGADTVSMFLRYRPKDNTWLPSEPIHSSIGNLQPAPAEVAPGHLIAFCRRGGGYENDPDGWIVYSESEDYGQNWAEGVRLVQHFPNPNAAVDLLQLRNGHLVLIYNHSHGRRTPLSLALSMDQGRTWKTGLDLGMESHDYAYPYAIQASDDRIHLVYTSHGRSRINRIVFMEDQIAGSFPSTVTL